MRGLIIKPAKDRDEYVIWSRSVEAPLAYGTRDEIQQILTECGTPEDADPARLDQADLHGSSALGVPVDGLPAYMEGWWGDEEWIYEQRGYLKRSDMYRAAQLLDEDRDPEVWDMLIPFEDKAEVRRG